MTISARTLYRKLWDSHVVAELPDGRSLLHVDRHLLHDGCAPVAFDGLARAGRAVRRADLTFGVVDHVVSTAHGSSAGDANGQRMIEVFREHCATTGIRLHDEHHPEGGIVHVVAPELGLTLPGSLVVCGDSHTSTHGAFGALAFGIGISEVEHVLATQTTVQRRAPTMCVRIRGELAAGVSAKDVALHLIATIGVSGGTGFAIEFAGDTIDGFSMEARMTLCNLSIEAGARVAVIAPDDITFRYLAGRRWAPRGAAWNDAVGRWRAFAGDPDASHDREVELDVSSLAPQVTWGTTPADTVAIDTAVPDPDRITDSARCAAARRKLRYMGLSPGQPLDTVTIDRVFIGSCTNARIEDLRSAAALLAGRRVAPWVRAWVVPGSRKVAERARAEGLDRDFVDAGFEWREPGCSMCLGMNGELLAPGERCASTSNRNFEGRQGRGGRTHLVSPATAAASALAGRLADPRSYLR